MSESTYKMVTDRIIAQLEQGIIPWEKPWVGSRTNFAFNRVTKRTYSFLNQLLLGQSGEWASFKQWKALGGKIKKGEKGSVVVFWKIIEKEKETEDGETVKEKIPMLRYYYVFHISQVEGVEPLKPTEYPDCFVPDDDADEIIEDYLTREKVKFLNVPDSDRSYYSPAKDMICVPEKKQFKDTNEYYGTVFHEMVHSTGHKDRLNRLETGAKAAFGGESYSKEELVAEIGSATILNMLNLETEKTFRNNVAYIQSWIKALKNDCRMIVSASSKADKAVTYILGNVDNNNVNNAKSERKGAEGNNSTPKEKVTKKEGKNNDEKAKRSHDKIIIDRVVRNAKKANIRYPDTWSPLTFRGQNYCAILDGHRIVASKNDFGYKESERPYDVTALFKPYESEKNLEYVKIDIKDVKAKSKELSAEHLPYVVENGKDKMGINPKYLIDALEFCKVDGFYYEKPDYEGCIKHPFFFCNEEQEKLAIVLPINITC